MFCKVRHWLVCLLLLTGLTACGGGGDSPPPPKAQTTTLLVYMVGSDLESGHGEKKGSTEEGGAATGNIQEMLQAASSDRVNVVLTTGGALKDDPGNLGLVKTWKTVKRHVVKDGKIRELQDIGQRNMADPATLSEFIQWARNTYPADRTMLVFWDHGAGYEGFGGDENFGAEGFMKLPAMVQGLKAAQQATGITFDYIGFDACLMSTVEVGNAMAPYARYLGASQELEPGTGADWKAMLDTLAANPDIDAAAFGKAVADSFIAKQNREADAEREKRGAAYLEDKYNTYAITDLRALAQVNTALTRFADAVLAARLLDDQESWKKVAIARAASISFGGRVAKDSDNYDLVDLYMFAGRLAAANLLTAESQALQQAVRAAVVYRKNGDRVQDTANGLSVYFPSRSVSTGADATLADTYAPLDMPASFKTMLKNFVAAANDSAHVLTIDAPQVAGAALSANVFSSAGMREAYAILSAGDDGGQTDRIVIDGIMLAVPNDYGGIGVPLDRQWLMLNGHPFAVTEIEQERDGEGNIIAYHYSIPVLHNGERSTLLVREQGSGPDRPEFEVIGVWAGLENGNLASRNGEPVQKDDKITLLRVIANLNANTFEVVASPMAPEFEAGSMDFSRLPLASGNYRLRFAVTDYRERNAFSTPYDYPQP